MIGKLILQILSSVILIHVVSSNEELRELWSTLRAIDANDLTERHRQSLDEIKKTNVNLEDSEIGYRLPNNSIPLRYDLHLTTDIDKGLFNFTGHVKIRLLIVENTKFITLHYRNQTIDRINLLNFNGVVMSYNLPYVKHELVEMVVIELPFAQLSGGEIILDILYRSELDARRGFYRSSYIDENGIENWVASTQFSPIDARHAVICYDEPKWRAVFSVSIQHDYSYHALSNMPVKSITEIPGSNYVVTHFLDSLSMQSYLLAFAISNFDYIQNNEVDVPQRIYAKKSSIMNGEADFIIHEVGPILRKCDELFGIPHALPKLDHIAVPYHVYSAMENYGLYTYAEWNILIDPMDAPQYTMLELFAHEIAHHLFGNYVNLPFWDQLWLKEGFATLYQFVVPAKIYPDKYFKDGLRTKACVRGATADRTTSIAMSTYVETEPEIRAKFDAISYSKAGCFLGMIMNAITEETWFKAMHYYLKDNALKTSDADDVHAALQQALDEDLSNSTYDIASIMKTWEDQPGFPIVSVEKSDGKIILKQERFYTKSGHIYSIPINYATASSPNFTDTKALIWMHDEILEIESQENDWIIINIQQTGYYRASYADNIWNSIIEALIRQHENIHWINRQQLFIDMEYAITSEMTSPIFSLRHLNYLKSEIVADVWIQGGVTVTDFHGKFYDTIVEELFKKFVDSLYEVHFQVLGFEDDAETDVLRNSLIDVSCRNGYQPCLNHATNKMMTEYASNHKFIDFCHGIRMANEAQFNSIYNFMLLINSTTRRNAAMNGLSCSHDAILLEKFLNSLLDKNIAFYTNANRAANIRKTMSESVKGLEAVMKFLVDNEDVFNDRELFAENAVVTIIDHFANVVNSEQQLNATVAIMNRFSLAYPQITPALTQSVISRINEKLEWKNGQNYEEIYDWLNTELRIVTTTAVADNASLITWSLFTLLCTLSFVIFAR